MRWIASVLALVVAAIGATGWAAEPAPLELEAKIALGKVSGRIDHLAVELAPSGRIDLKDDADNIRIDTAANRVYIGYGSGALAVIDAATQAKLADIALKAHPEGFQLDPASGRIYVNVPDARQIAVVDRAAGKQIAAW